MNIEIETENSKLKDVLENKKIFESDSQSNNLGTEVRTQKKTGQGKMFGLISGSITTIGIMVGLWQSHNNIWIIISGILSIAFSDSFSDGLGMYFSQRVDKSQTEAIRIGFKTTLYKMLVTLSFILPFIILNIEMAIQINIIWGLLLIAYASYQLDESIMINLLVALMVILTSYLGGNIVNLMTKFIQPN